MKSLDRAERTSSGWLVTTVAMGLLATLASATVSAADSAPSSSPRSTPDEHELHVRLHRVCRSRERGMPGVGAVRVFHQRNVGQSLHPVLVAKVQRELSVRMEPVVAVRMWWACAVRHSQEAFPPSRCRSRSLPTGESDVRCRGRQARPSYGCLHDRCGVHRQCDCRQRFRQRACTGCCRALPLKGFRGPPPQSLRRRALGSRSGQWNIICSRWRRPSPN